jgi:hypothetical protein
MGVQPEAERKPDIERLRVDSEAQHQRKHVKTGE